MVFSEKKKWLPKYLCRMACRLGHNKASSNVFPRWIFGEKCDTSYMSDICLLAQSVWSLKSSAIASCSLFAIIYKFYIDAGSYSGKTKQSTQRRLVSCDLRRHSWMIEAFLIGGIFIRPRRRRCAFIIVIYERPGSAHTETRHFVITWGVLSSCLSRSCVCCVLGGRRDVVTCGWSEWRKWRWRWSGVD